MSLHRCIDAECPHLGQATNRGCGCHKTDEQVLTEQRDALLEAMEPFRAAHPAYVKVMRSFTVTGETWAERHFSEGERRATALEAAYEALTTITFEQMAAVDAAIALAKGEQS